MKLTFEGWEVIVIILIGLIVLAYFILGWLGMAPDLGNGGFY